MSFQAMKWAEGLKIMGPAKGVLMCLAWFHNSDTGQCDPGAKTIGTWLGCSERTARRAIVDLAALGVLTRTHRAGRQDQCDLNLSFTTPDQVPAPKATSCPEVRTHSPDPKPKRSPPFDRGHTVRTTPDTQSKTPDTVSDDLQGTAKTSAITLASLASGAREDDLDLPAFLNRRISHGQADSDDRATVGMGGQEPCGGLGGSLGEAPDLDREDPPEPQRADQEVGAAQLTLLHAVDGDVLVRTPDDVDEAFRLFGEAVERNGRWPKPSLLSDVRRGHIRRRLRDAGGLEGWKVALEKAEASDFLARKMTGFGLDWVLKPANFTKIMEGNYDGQSEAAGSLGGSTVRPHRATTGDGAFFERLARIASEDDAGERDGP